MTEVEFRLAGRGAEPTRMGVVLVNRELISRAEALSATAAAADTAADAAG